MAENNDFVHGDYKTIDFTAAAAINAGEIQLVQDTYVLSMITLAISTVGAGVYYSDWCEVPKATGTGMSFSIGDSLWLDTTALTVHPTFATGDIWVGTAKETASTSATHVNAVFDGRKRS